MTGDERERLRALEIQYDYLTRELQSTRQRLDETNVKMDQLLALLNQGKGMKVLVSAVFAVGGIGGLMAVGQTIAHLFAR